MYLLSTVISVNLLYLFSFIALRPNPTNARTLHRWGSLDLLSHGHVYSHSQSHSQHTHAHLAIPIMSPTTNTNAKTNSDSTTQDMDPFDPSLSAVILKEEEKEEQEEDDWQKYHHEQTEQRDMWRKLECRSVEFGRCDVKRKALRIRTLPLDVEVAGEGEVEGEGKGKEEGDEFVGRRLPRALQVWLAREGGGGGGGR
jgi:hypothetical protein